MMICARFENGWVLFLSDPKLQISVLGYKLVKPFRWSRQHSRQFGSIRRKHNFRWQHLTRLMMQNQNAVLVTCSVLADEALLFKNLFFSSKWKKHLPNKNCNITKYLYFNKTKRSFNHSINFLAVYICFYLQKIRTQKKESFLPRFKILEYKTAPKILRKMQASADLQK